MLPVLVPTCNLHPSYLTSMPSLLSLGALDEIINPRIPLRKQRRQSNYRACTRLCVPFVALGEKGEGERREERKRGPRRTLPVPRPVYSIITDTRAK